VAVASGAPLLPSARAMFTLFVGGSYSPPGELTPTVDIHGRRNRKAGFHAWKNVTNQEEEAEGTKWLSPGGGETANVARSSKQERRSMQIMQRARRQPGKIRECTAARKAKVRAVTGQPSPHGRLLVLAGAPRPQSADRYPVGAVLGTARTRPSPAPRGLATATYSAAALPTTRTAIAPLPGGTDAWPPRRASGATGVPEC